MKTADKLRVLEVIEELINRRKAVSSRMIALKLEINPQRFTDMKSGKGKVDLDLIAKFEKHYHINPEFIRTGESSMFKNEEKATNTTTNTKPMEQRMKELEEKNIILTTQIQMIKEFVGMIKQPESSFSENEKRA